MARIKSSMSHGTIDKIIHQIANFFFVVLHSLFFVARSPYLAFYSRFTQIPLHRIAQTPSPDACQKLVESFFKNKLKEAQYVQVAGTLILAATIACLSWSTPLQRANWSGPALWYAGIILSLTSIVMGAQQALAIPGSTVTTPPVSTNDSIISPARTQTHVSENYATTFRRRLLRKPRAGLDALEDGKREPRMAILFAWQMPIMVFAYSVACFMAGLSSVVISPLAQEGGKWGDEAKTAVVYLVAVAAGFLAFSGTSWSLYSVVGRGEIG